MRVRRWHEYPEVTSRSGGGMSFWRWHENPDAASVSGGNIRVRRWHAWPEVACVSGGGVRVCRWRACLEVVSRANMRLDTHRVNRGARRDDARYRAYVLIAWTRVRRNGRKEMKESD